MNYSSVSEHVLLVISITLLMVQLFDVPYPLFTISLVSILITRCLLGEMDFGLTFPMNDVVGLLVLWVISIVFLFYFDPKMMKK